MPVQACALVSCLLLLLGAGEWKLAAPRPLADGRPLENPAWKELSCSGCHEDVAREWARTTHATAWLDPRYQEAIAEKRKPEACHNCHIPEPLSGVEPGTKPRPRDASESWTHLGVDCNACHFGKEREILGPLGAPTKAHASKKSVLFTPEGQSQLCLSCHATNVGPVIGIGKDFVETRQWERGQSCVGCHMQALEREFVSDPARQQAELGDAPYPKRAGRSHELQSPRDPAFLARAFEISARVAGAGTRVSIRNACGHRVPGLIGRELEIEVELLDAGGKSLGKQTLALDHTRHLGTDAEAVLEFAEAGARLRLRGLHRSPGIEQPALFLEGEIPVAR
jgi:hypothetical protein